MIFRMEMIKKAKSITYGPEILYAYLLAKETEIKEYQNYISIQA